MNEDLLQELSVGQHPSRSIITVMGVGGAGGNAVNHMWDMGIEGVNFLVCNTDQQALNKSSVENKLRLGRSGLGAGNDPEEGLRATIESLEEVRRRLESLNTEMLFITAGMGGGTGTGASPALAKLAKEMGILTVGIITSPLLCEGNFRYKQAIKGIEELRECVDSLLVLNNENILELYGDLPVIEAFSKADDILCSAAKGIAEIITKESFPVNIDFADVSRVMRDSGRTHMSVEYAKGENRAEEVAQRALNSPLLDNNCIIGAKNILLQFSTCSIKELTLSEITKVQQFIQAHALTFDESRRPIDANIIWGTSEKPTLEEGVLELVLVATGLDMEEQEEQEPTHDISSKVLGPKSPILDPFIDQKSDLEPIKTPKDTSHIVPASMTKNTKQRQVILSESSSKYADIESLLAEPAYKIKGAKFVTEVPVGRHEVVKSDDDDQHEESEQSVDTNEENLLFSKLDE